jgi:hypothetical protein
VTYSSRESEQSIMAVNTFVQDSADANPLCPHDEPHPHRERRRESRHTASQRLEGPSSFSISKLYDAIPWTSSKTLGLVGPLRDGNPMVVSQNATAAICENLRIHPP